MEWSDALYAQIVREAVRATIIEERADWRAVFAESRELWRSAYERSTDWPFRLELPES